MKHIHYNEIFANRYFWRTQQQQEIDYIEERDGILHAYEIKWKTTSKPRAPLTFTKAYPDYHFELLTTENYEPFLGLERN